MFERLKARKSAAASGGTAPSASPAPGAPRRRLGRLGKVLLGIAIFLAAFAVIGFFVVPPVAKHYLVKILSEQLGRQVSIADIDVNPFAMTAVVKGFKVMEPAGSPVFVSVDEFLVNAEYRSILRLAPVLKQIRVAAPYVHIVRNPDGNTYNFTDLIEKFLKDTPDEPSNAKFSLNNIELVGGKIEFDDRPKQAKHVVSDIALAIPFISNLPDRVEEYIQPAFSARVNGTPVALKGRTKPFKDTLETVVDLNIDKLELPRYIEYVPLKLGFRMPSGILDTRLTLSFVQQSPQPLVLIKGRVDLQKLSLTEPGGAPLFNLGNLTVPVDTIDVFGARYAFGRIALTSPEVFVQRAQDGALNWVRVQPLVGDGKPAAEPARPSKGPEMSLTVAEVALANGTVHVDDQVPEKDFRVELTGIEASVTEFALPQKAPAKVNLAFATDKEATVKLATSLLLDPLTAEGNVEVAKVKLTEFENYYAPFILYRVEDGRADLNTGFAFRMAEGGLETQLNGFNLDLADVRMRKPGEKEDFLRARSAQIKDAAVDVNKLVLTVGEFVTRDGLLNIIREPDGALNATRVLPAPEEKNQPTQQGTPWQITLNKADVDKWRLAFTDLTLGEPVKIVADAVRLRASGVSNQPGKTGRIDLQAKLNESGSMKAAGAVSLAPVKADLDLDVQAFGLVPLQPYFTDKVNILLSSADASVKGKALVAMDAAGKLAASFQGEAGLTDFASIEKSSSEDLLKWQSLFVAGIDYNLEPMSLSIDEVALSNFFARIIIFPDGHLNLQDIVVKEGGATPAADGEPASNTGATATAAQQGPQSAAQKTAQASPTPGRDSRPGTDGREAAAPPPEQPAAMPPIRIAKVTLQGGDVSFTDLFIKPNYSANLSEIGGSVLGLSSELNTTADVDLRGRFAKTAPVEIKGKVNPLVENLFLDLAANVRDIELGPFTPYSGKYVGYAIEKGKMSFDVSYKIENRKLAAQNKLVLDQLTFGEKVESPDAIKLPVLLAVALLKDRNGVIDVNLPISGSLDDPKFSIGGIVIRIIFNLIEKAVTAPFALIGNLLGGGGGGEELSFIEFDYGSFVLSQDGQDKVSKLQTALVDRPGLKLDITGRVDPAQDREGLRKARFDQQVKAQKLKDLVKKGAAVQSVDEVTIEAAEYEKYLKRAYREAKFAKPRNAIGMVKDLPKEEMEKLMLTNIQVSDDDLTQLAIQRAQSAKDAITRDGKVPLERVFLLAPKIEAGKAEDKNKPSRVEFSLK